MSTKRVNMKDIALEAGVSVATVSYIINGRSDQTINPQTIRKVKEVIERLGYVPNLGARALASRKTRLLGLVIPQTEQGKMMMFSNSFYGEFLSAFELEARQRGYNILISGTNLDQSYVEVAQKRCLDGVVIVGMKEESNLKGLDKANIPVVFVDSYDFCRDYYSINIDDKAGGFLATEYLYKKGHRNIGLLTGMVDDTGVNYERYLGYKDCLLSKGLEFNEANIFAGTVSFDWGIKVGMSFKDMENRPSAVFASADLLAAGFIKGLRKVGLKVPQDVSVIGFDDGFIATSIDPELTTIHQNVNSKGALAADLIIKAVEEANTEVTNILLPVSLVERESVITVK